MPRHATRLISQRSALLLLAILVAVASTACQRKPIIDTWPTTVVTSTEITSAEKRISNAADDDVLAQVAEVGGIAGINQPTTAMYGDGRVITRDDRGHYRTVTVSSDDRRALLATAIASTKGRALPEETPVPDGFSTTYSLRTESGQLKVTGGTYELEHAFTLMRDRAKNGTPTAAPPMR